MSVSQSSTLVQTEISKQLLNGLTGPDVFTHNVKYLDINQMDWHRSRYKYSWRPDDDEY